MTREQSWQVTDPTTLALLRTIAAAGYTVSVFRLGKSMLGTVPAMVEMHAHDVSAEPVLQHVAKVEQSEPDAEYRCAVELAKLVGIRMEG